MRPVSVSPRRRSNAVGDDGGPRRHLREPHPDREPELGVEPERRAGRWWCAERRTSVLPRHNGEGPTFELHGVPRAPSSSASVMRLRACSPRPPTRRASSARHSSSPTGGPRHCPSRPVLRSPRRRRLWRGPAPRVHRSRARSPPPRAGRSRPDAGYDRAMSDVPALVDEIANELDTWPGVHIERRADGAAVIRYEELELGALDLDRGVAELRFSRPVHDELVERGDAEAADSAPDSDRVLHGIAGPADVTAVLESSIAATATCAARTTRTAPRIQPETSSDGRLATRAAAARGRRRRGGRPAGAAARRLSARPHAAATDSLHFGANALISSPACLIPSSMLAAFGISPTISSIDFAHAAAALALAPS